MIFYLQFLRTLGYVFRSQRKRLIAASHNSSKTFETLTRLKRLARVDLYQKLLDIYNDEKFRWVQFKNDARPRDFSNQSEVDAYDSKLASGT